MKHGRKMKCTLISLYLLVGLKIVSSTNYSYSCNDCQPHQIHIAFGEKINDIVITWTTYGDARESVVKYGSAELHSYLKRRACGKRNRYKDLRGQWIHRVTLKNLRYNTTYSYRCGSRYAWSDVYNFTTVPETEAVLTAAVYGDMGVENSVALPYINHAARERDIDFIIHVGDFAYDMHDDDSRKGDEFMEMIQPATAVVPYMVCPGNHEYIKNFTQYKSRMTMPYYKKWQSMFYSWDIGPVHFVSINTEAYYFLMYGTEPLVNQYRWLVEDLKQANSKENRKMRPWIVMYGHRPMYYSGGTDQGEADCSNERTRVGVEGIGYKETFALEPLLVEYGVDVAIWAHQHMYERSLPMFNCKVYKGSTDNPYVNPRAPVHIIAGAGGCLEAPNRFLIKQPAWCAFRSSGYGYTKFSVYNKTHVFFEHKNVESRGDTVDTFWVVQDHHGPFRSPSRMKKPK